MDEEYFLFVHWQVLCPDSIGELLDVRGDPELFLRLYQIQTELGLQIVEVDLLVPFVVEYHELATEMLDD